MAEKAKHGNYVKIVVNVWYDKKGKNVHLTSNDKDLPGNNMHIAVKKGIQSEQNLLGLLDKFDCGPAAAAADKTAMEEFNALLAKIESGELDDSLEKFEEAIAARKG
jgi:hypothetical protein